MRTPLTIKRGTPLAIKGQALMVAAHEYWKEYQKTCGSCAVVWVDDESGHFVLFTRGEYREDIMGRIPRIANEASLVHPFEK